ncbi:MAG: hypothetical protein KDC57_21790, partial [Saprospiraceae bacterium]|nr:hypothetical protein [Saprospiraceae bacterium]
MNRIQARTIWTIELIGWVFTGIMMLLMLLPITRKIYQFPFLISNLWFIGVFITLLRWLFLLPYSFFARIQWLKILMMAGCIPLFLYTLRLFKEFNEYINDEGLESFMYHLTNMGQESMEPYVRSEVTFFAVAALMTTVVFFFRL